MSARTGWQQLPADWLSERPRIALEVCRDFHVVSELLGGAVTNFLIGAYERTSSSVR